MPAVNLGVCLSVPVVLIHLHNPQSALWSVPSLLHCSSVDLFSNSSAGDTGSICCAPPMLHTLLCCLWQLHVFCLCGALFRTHTHSLKKNKRLCLAAKVSLCSARQGERDFLSFLACRDHISGACLKRADGLIGSR